MAIVLRFMNETSQAEERCKMALELNPNNWRASLLRAKLTKSPRPAIDILKNLSKHFVGDENLQKRYPEAFGDIAFYLGDRYWDEERTEKAIKLYTESIQRDPYAPQHVYHIMSKYSEVGEWNEITKLLAQVRKQAKARFPDIVVAMHDEPMFHAIFRRAYIKTGKLDRDYVEIFYEEAILIAKDRDYRASFHLRHMYASALSAVRPVVPPEKVSGILEDAVKDLQHTNLPLAPNFFRVGYRLGTIYLGRAQEAKAVNKPEVVERWLNQLVKIVPEQLNEDQMSLPLSLFAARYHVTNDDEESARASAHGTLRMAVELLSDNESGNDYLAFEKILYAAIPFGDKTNATAALAMMQRDSGFERSCSSGCGKKWLTPGKMFWCKDCINVVLKPECHERVKNAAPDIRVCDASHKHLEIHKWDTEKMNVPEGQVPYNGKAITMEDWSKRISEEYHLGMSKSAILEGWSNKISEKVGSGKSRLHALRR